MPRKGSKRRREQAQGSDRIGEIKRRRKKEAAPTHDEATSQSFPPQGDGILAGACAELRVMVESLLYEGCMEIDSSYVDMHRKRRQKFSAARAPILHRINKLQKFVKETHDQAMIVVEDMLGRVDEDGLVVKAKFK